MNEPQAGQPATYFAPPERSEPAELARLAETCVNNAIIEVVLESLDSHVLVLDARRQILAANPVVLKDLELLEGEPLLGARPGEAFGCVNLAEAPSGCGTSEACRNCGLVLAVLASQATHAPAEGECLLSMRRHQELEGREYHVRVTPIRIEEDLLQVAVLRDVSDTKRREVLESTFLHDLNNVLQGLNNWTEVLQASPGGLSRVAQQIVTLSSWITQEVALHRVIVQAEQGNLVTHPEPLKANPFLEGLLLALEGHGALNGKALAVDPLPPEDGFICDPALLRRVLTNMLVNALEASTVGATVRITFSQEKAGPRFQVHNPGWIVPEVGNSIFHRSFSTKAAKGRGLGTYIMKLLGENYLRGAVNFRSSEGEGTCFWIQLPRDASEPG
jgi:signal transduction histidine kinase